MGRGGESLCERRSALGEEELGVERHIARGRAGLDGRRVDRRQDNLDGGQVGGGLDPCLGGADAPRATLEALTTRDCELAGAAREEALQYTARRS